MMNSILLQDIINLVGDMNEVIVGDYFKSRGFEIKKLDSNQDPNPSRNCDWLVQGRDTSFLCELKTINSVQKGTKTQAEFRKKFENRVRDYFSRRKDVRDLPYHLHFHSDTLSIPPNELFTDCLKSISRMLLDIHGQEEKQPFWGLSCCGGAFDLIVSRSWSGNLEIQVSSYGGLNSRLIEDRIGDGIGQLKRSGKDHFGIARLIILAFAGGIHITQASEVVVFGELQFKEEDLWRHIDMVLKRNSDLSGIAVMNGQSTQFGVFHNPVLTEVESLDKSVFSDGASVQFDSFDTIPRVTVKPFNLQDFTASFLEAARNERQKAITIADYEALKKEKTSKIKNNF